MTTIAIILIIAALVAIGCAGPILSNREREREAAHRRLLDELNRKQDNP